MSAVLGVSFGYHDSAAALVVDGEVVAAVQQERLSRIRFDASFPDLAIDWCLAKAGLSGPDLDSVMYYENPFAHCERVLKWHLQTWPRGWRSFPKALSSQLRKKIWVLDHLAKYLRIDRSKVGYIDHHTSHAASAFYCSPFEKAAILTLDGIGEFATTTISVGDGNAIERRWENQLPNSLGLVYAAITAWLGFAVNDGEYKVMALASYGTPRYLDELRRIIRDDGTRDFQVHPKYLGYLVDLQKGYGPALTKLLGDPRPSRRPWDMTSPDDQRYCDVAASLQVALEETTQKLAESARTAAGVRSLCMAGGVALNCVSNAKIAKEGPLYVQPAAGDAGGALGAALAGAIALGDKRPSHFASMALGPSLNVGRGAEIATHLGFRVDEVDPVTTTASLLNNGHVVGWAQGRTEWGPRALGNRSILADARRADAKERINRSVKNREAFRPFAPAVSVDNFSTYFDGVPDLLTPFMCTVRSALDQAAVPAAIHVDGTARVQSVSDGVFKAVLREIPVVVNTSLNVAGDPIASSEADILSLFLTSPIDALIMENLLITKP